MNSQKINKLKKKFSITEISVEETAVNIRDCCLRLTERKYWNKVSTPTERH